ncbi:MAG: FkbM family methyltransferase [Anaerolineae bacterium]|nr:FkbM family methyltransferase [Anaerolineae bacterium]
MKLVHYFNRPEYLFRPHQIYRKVFHSKTSYTHQFKKASLPWGSTINIFLDRDDRVGRSIIAHGIYDLALTETVWRLSAPGETAVDVGANIGYVTSVLARRVSLTGKVYSFEPNPEVYELLLKNVEGWRKSKEWSPILTYPTALSRKSGAGMLQVPLGNRGEASLISTRETGSLKDNTNCCVAVTLAALDEIIEDSSPIGVMKLDVEGHELSVLHGSKRLINAGHIRDIIFEDHQGYPSPVTCFLEKHGYTIFRLWKGFWGPKLKLPQKQLIHPWEPPNYLATREVARAVSLFNNVGWYSLFNQDTLTYQKK